MGITIGLEKLGNRHQTRMMLLRCAAAVTGPAVFDEVYSARIIGPITWTKKPRAVDGSKANFQFGAAHTRPRAKPPRHACVHTPSNGDVVFVLPHVRYLLPKLASGCVRAVGCAHSTKFSLLHIWVKKDHLTLVARKAQQGSSGGGAGGGSKEACRCPTACGRDG